MKVGAKRARDWLEHNRHLPDHVDAHVTVGLVRELCKAAVAVDDIDALTARIVDRKD